MITLLATSFLAGILTILTPCSLPLLPVVLGGSINNKFKYRPAIIVASLALSVFVFTLILKTGVNALTTDNSVLRLFSGIVIFLLGLFYIYPNLWENLSERFKINNLSSNLLIKSQKTSGIFSAILTGIALGPIFSSCSPTYGYILFAILPLDLTKGILCLLVFILGMSLFLILLALLGQKLVDKAKWLANPHSKFKLVLGIIFIVVGLSVITRLDKTIESFLLEQKFIQTILPNQVEQNIINSL